MRGLAAGGGDALGHRELRVSRLEHNVPQRGTPLLLTLETGVSRRLPYMMSADMGEGVKKCSRFQDKQLNFFE